MRSVMPKRLFHIPCIQRVSLHYEFAGATWGLTCSWMPSHTPRTWRVSLPCGWCRVEGNQSYLGRLSHILCTQSFLPVWLLLCRIKLEWRVCRPFHTQCTHRASSQCGSGGASWGMTCSWRPSCTSCTHRVSPRCGSYGAKGCYVLLLKVFPHSAFIGLHSNVNPFMSNKEAPHSELSFLGSFSLRGVNPWSQVPSWTFDGPFWPLPCPTWASPEARWVYCSWSETSSDKARRKGGGCVVSGFVLSPEGNTTHKRAC